MRILKVHNRYEQRGGEDIIFESETSLLREHGHDIETLVYDNRNIAPKRSPLANARLAATTIWSHKAAAEILEACRRFEPEVVHFHNTFPQVSPGAYSAARATGAAVVQTLPNFRLVCPAATLFRDGELCEDCVGHLPLAGVLHACYHGSHLQTAAVAAMLAFHRARNTWDRDVDRFIALTDFAREKLIEGGLPAARISIKPDFVYPDPGQGDGPRAGFAFIGRLVREKGIETALDAWSTGGPDADLVVANRGPLAPAVTEALGTNDRIKDLGAIDRSEAMRLVRESMALLFPSVWYEPFGMAIIEAFAAATPVIASRRGGSVSLIEDGVTGIFFEPGDADDLRSKVNWALAHPEQMRRIGNAGRREFERKYTGDRNHHILLDIYQEAIAHRNADELVTV